MNSKDWRPTAFVDTAPGVGGEHEAGPARQGQRDHLLAFVRQLLALDTLALVLVAMLADKAFASAQRRDAVTIAVGAFQLSLAIGGLAHLALPGRRTEAGSPQAPAGAGALLACSAATFAAFAAGMAALAWFFFANWLR
jgi:hypothetical protein